MESYDRLLSVSVSSPAGGHRHPWPTLMLWNGNHSTLAAQLRGGGKLTCEETYDLSPILKAVRTGGAQWYRVDDGSSSGPVDSMAMAMAGIFVIGQRLIKP